MKILIAGAGIAGSVLARMLRERDHDVTVTDPRPHTAASRCAFAYLRTAWWQGPEREEVRRAVDWYEERGWVLTRDGWVTDVRRGRDFRQSDHVLIDPRAPLVKADLSMRLNRYMDGPGGVLTTLGDGVQTDATHLVLACGAGMDRWSSGTPVHGGIYECDDYRMITPLKLLRVTDRLTYTAADDGTVTRVGASKARTPEAARERAGRILDRMMDAGIVTCTRPWTYRAGTRWEHLGGSSGGGRQISEHVWSFTGFARSGYARVPGAARKLIERMDQR